LNREFKVTIYPKEEIDFYIYNGNKFESTFYFHEIIRSIKAMNYYTDNYEEACLFIPNLDHTLADAEKDSAYQVGKKLRDLPFWNEGKNHLLFSTHDYKYLQYDPGYAIIAKVGFSWKNYRPEFDVSIPPPTDLQKYNATESYYGWDEWINTKFRNNTYLASFKGHFSHEVRYSMRVLHNPEKGFIFVPKNASKYSYSDLLRTSEFGLCPRGKGLFSYRITESMQAGAIPVILADDYVLPFQEFLDWKTFSVIVPQAHWQYVPEILKSITPEEINFLRKNLYFVYHNYFRDIRHHVIVAIDIIKANIYGPKANNLIFGPYLNLVSRNFTK